MAFITIPEILDAVILSACIGYIFSSYFSRFNAFKKLNAFDVLGRRRFNWSDFLFAIAIVAPAIILHELGHKFVATAFGYEATFFSALSINKLFYGIPFFDFASILMIVALVSTYFGSSFLFFVPAYVTFSAAATPLQSVLIAGAGPFVNLILWLVFAGFSKIRKLPHKYLPVIVKSMQVNMILFIFNMLPIPGFDGFKVFAGLWSMFF